MGQVLGHLELAHQDRVADRRLRVERDLTGLRGGTLTLSDLDLAQACAAAADSDAEAWREAWREAMRRGLLRA